MSKTLFVEGEEDKKLFLSINRAVGAQVELKCDPRGKDNAMNSFFAMLRLQTSASKNSIGLIVDADSTENGGGFSSTQARLNQKLQAINWSPLAKTQNSGYSTTCSNSRGAKAGVWIMPNNANDGCLEGFVMEVISKSQQSLSNYAFKQTLQAIKGGAGIPPLPTRPHQIDKAKVGTWLAWNDPPRMSLGKAHTENLLDLSSGIGKSLSTWLGWLYA